MNYACTNCRQNPVASPGYYCSTCLPSFQPLPCAYCGAANQPGQPACWQCNSALAALPTPPTNPQANWQCACGYAYNVSSTCSNCHRAKVLVPWKCDTCGYEYSLYEACDKCKNPKVGKKIYAPPTTAPKQPQKPWKCAKCQYEYNLEDICLKCKTAKPKPRATPGCCVAF